MSEVDVVETDTKSETLEVEDRAARERMEDTAASAFSLVRTEDRGSPPFLPTSSAGRARDQTMKLECMNRAVKEPEKHRYCGFALGYLLFTPRESLYYGILFIYKHHSYN